MNNSKTTILFHKPKQSFLLFSRIDLQHLARPIGKGKANLIMIREISEDGHYAFQGFAEVEVLEGECTCLGYKLKPGRKFRMLSNPAQEGAGLEIRSSKQSKRKKLQEVEDSLRSEPPRKKQKVSSTAKIRVKEVPEKDLAEDLCQITTQCFAACDSWNKAFTSICKHSCPIVFMFGERNTGKSTFARMAVNRLLNHFDSVGYVDTDVGQPQFTCEGVMSYVVLSEPIFTPNYCSSSQPEASLYFGSNNCLASTNTYIKFGEHLINMHQQNRANIPLVINTQGWAVGGGLSMLLRFLKKSQPTHVVALMKNWHIEATESQIKSVLNTTVHFLQPYAGSEGGKPARARRKFAVCRYFRPKLLEHVVALPFKQISGVMLYSRVKPSLIFRALVCTLIGLLQVQDIDSNNDFTLLDTLSENHAFIAHGVITSIDQTKQVFYIATPERDLSSVNCIARGNLQVPTELTFQADPCQATPYLMGDGLTIRESGAAPISSRNTIRRKKI